MEPSFVKCGRCDHFALHHGEGHTCAWPGGRCCCTSFLEPVAAEPPVGTKFDAGKLRYTLLPWRAVDEVVRVLEHGAAKYGEENWREVPNARQRYLNAALRHIRADLAGENLDRDSKRRTLAHAICSLLFVVELDEALDEKISDLHVAEARP